MSEVRAKGLALLASLLGDAYVEKRALTTNSFNRDLRELSEHCVGTVWTRRFCCRAAGVTLPTASRSR